MLKENEWCDANKGTHFKTLSDSQSSCFEDDRCTMFYDFKSENSTFYTCNYKTKITVNSGPIISQSALSSRLYLKCEEYEYSLTAIPLLTELSEQPIIDNVCQCKSGEFFICRHE